MADYGEETSTSDNGEPNGDFHCGGPRLSHKSFAVKLADATNEVVNNFTFEVNGSDHSDDSTPSPKTFDPGTGNAPARVGGNVFDYAGLDKLAGDSDGD